MESNLDTCRKGVTVAQIAMFLYRIGLVALLVLNASCMLCDSLRGQQPCPLMQQIYPHIEQDCFFNGPITSQSSNESLIISMWRKQRLN